MCPCGSAQISEASDTSAEAKGGDHAHRAVPTGHTAAGRTQRTARPGKTSRTGARTTAARSGGASSSEYRVLDAPTRQRHLQLWASRLAADRLIARQAAELPQNPRAKEVPRAAISYTHELSADNIGFAFGGVDPGTLHAHGKLH